jgi:UDP-glucose:glycoprotein glucosyltransferase
MCFSETAAAEHPGHYFDIVDALVDRSSAGLLGPLTDPSHKPQYVYHTALALLQARGFLTEPNALSTFEKNLALHSATPKIQAFYQLLEDESTVPDCGSWIEFSQRRACTIEDVDKILDERTDNSPIQVLPFDHIQKRTNDECLSRAIFYASPSSENFHDLYSYLRSKLEKPGFCFIMRYAPVNRSIVPEEHTRNTLSGYGVALDLKVRCFITY